MPAKSGTNSTAGRTAAERIRFAVERHPWPLRAVTVSIGLATMEGTAVDAEELVERADRGLYAAKGEGRNRVGEA